MFPVRLHVLDIRTLCEVEKVLELLLLIRPCLECVIDLRCGRTRLPEYRLRGRCGAVVHEVATYVVEQLSQLVNIVLVKSECQAGPEAYRRCVICVGLCHDQVTLMGDVMVHDVCFLCSHVGLLVLLDKVSVIASINLCHDLTDKLHLALTLK